jgi:hypothetical protein
MRGAEGMEGIVKKQREEIEWVRSKGNRQGGSKE